MRGRRLRPSPGRGRLGVGKGVVVWPGRALLWCAPLAPWLSAAGLEAARGAGGLSCGDPAGEERGRRGPSGRWPSRRAAGFLSLSWRGRGPRYWSSSSGSPGDSISVSPFYRCRKVGNEISSQSDCARQCQRCRRFCWVQGLRRTTLWFVSGVQSRERAPSGSCGVGSGGGAADRSWRGERGGVSGACCWGLSSPLPRSLSLAGWRVISCLGCPGSSGYCLCLQRHCACLCFSLAYQLPAARRAAASLQTHPSTGCREAAT